MTAGDGKPDPITAAGDLTEALNGMARRLEQVRSYGRKTRVLTVSTIVSVTLDVLLTAGLGIVIHEQHATSASNLALCQSSNRSRAQQIELWEFVLHLGGPPKTQKQADIDARFVAHLRKIFAPRDCAHLGRGQQ